MKQAWLIDLGVRDYPEAWELQLDLVARRARDEIPDVLFLLEHPHVYTVGRKSRDQRREIRVGSESVPCHAIERGGDITYHGPGQLVGYPISKLPEHERDLHGYLRNIEEVLIRTCADFGIPVERRPGLTGVWTSEKISRKIASIGVAVKHWVTYHGFALNVSTDLRFFHAINPCGFDASVMTSMERYLEKPISLTHVKNQIAEHFSSVFHITLEDAPGMLFSNGQAANVTKFV